jgi:PIN domain nuclease of toxin-antitoxin system
VAERRVRLLLDTQVLLWWLEESPRLSPEAYAEIADPHTSAWVSAVSPWEIEIKRSRRRLTIAPTYLDRISESFASLAISMEHAVAAGRLPTHHGDPFDRMLVAQAQLEGLTIVTSDPKIARYQVAILPA